MANISQGQLRAIINQMVEQAVGEKMGARAASWQSDQRRIQAGLSYDRRYSQTTGSTNFSGLGYSMRGLGQAFSEQNLRAVENNYESARKNFINAPDGEEYKKATDNYLKALKDQSDPSRTAMAKMGRILNGVGEGLQGFGGLQNAYHSRDPIGGMQSGYQMLTGIGGMFPAVAKNTKLMEGLGWAGMAIGLLAGLFGKKKEINEWNKPKFKDAEQAYNKLFTVDRGERDLYHMPESFYFRNGWSGSRHIVVKVGNEQFNDHIRESMTSSYSNQLQRGLVF